MAGGSHRRSADAGRGGLSTRGPGWSPERLLPNGPAVERPSTVEAFLRDEITTDRGEPMGFDNRAVWRPIVRLLAEIVESGRPDQSIDVLSGAQVGKSTLMGGMGAALPGFGWNTIYFLPTDVLAARFDDTRFIPMIRRGPWLSQALRDDTGREVSRKTLHSINGRWAYILGLDTVNNAIAIQADALIYDEADLIPSANLQWSADRLDGSSLRLELGISVGMFDGAGQHERYLRGSQNVWVVKCPACGCDDQVLEELFPDCVQQVRGAWARVCVRCGKPYDVEQAGRWVPRFPSRETEGRRSFRIPQLVVPAVALDRVMAKYARAEGRRSQLAKFNCSTLARPDGGDLQPVTDARLEAARILDYAMVLAPSPAGATRYSGIDTGDAAHYACHEVLPNGRRRYVWFEEMDSAELVERVNHLDEVLGVRGRVCDAKPLRNEARALAAARPRETWLLDFAGDSEEPEQADGEHYGLVYQRATVGRDAAMDDFLGLFGTEPCGVLLPSRADGPVLNLVAQHLKRLTKEPKEDARGNSIHSYRHGVENHFGFAMLSSYLAEQLSGGSAHVDVATMAPREGGGVLRGYGYGGGGRLRAVDVLEGY